MAANSEFWPSHHPLHPMIARSPHAKGLNVLLTCDVPGHMLPGPLFSRVFLKLRITAELASKDTLPTRQPSEQNGEPEQLAWPCLEPVDVSSDGGGLESTVFAYGARIPAAP